MNDAQKAFQKFFERLEGVKEHRQFFKSNPDFYQALNLVFNTEWPWLYILQTIWWSILDLEDNGAILVKGNRIKPQFMDDLVRTVKFGMSMEGVKWVNG